jgi:3',5'-cyclic AMP phosphodiesterase CpdA
MKRTLLLLGISIWILSGCNQSAKTTVEQDENGFSFAFLTDIHLQPEKGAETGFQWAINEVNKRNPDFVLTGGDLVMDVLNQSYGRSDSLYNLYIKLSGNFKMPVYNTVGNHEVYGWHRNEKGIEQHPEFGKKMFETRLGERYYSFNHKGWHFIILDAIYRGEEGGYIGRVDEEQIIWLAEELQKVDKETPIAVSVHIPFITSATQLMRGSMAANSEGSVINNSLEVLGLFSEHNLRLVLQGHLHYLEDIYVQNQVHFITGGAVSGRWWGNEPDSKPEEGFVMVHVDGEELDWEYVDFGWTPPEEN